MPFLLTLRLGRTFYQSFVLPSALVSLSCAFFFREYGFGSIGPVFWLKALATGAIFLFVNSYRQAGYYYFYNLGLTRARLWALALLMDAALLLLLLLLARFAA